MDTECAEKEDDVKIHSQKKRMGRLRQSLEQGRHKLRERQGLWAAPRSQERGQGQTIPQSLLLEEASPVHTLTLDSSLQNCERIHFPCFKRPVSATLLQWPQEADIVAFPPPLRRSPLPSHCTHPVGPRTPRVE